MNDTDRGGARGNWPGRWRTAGTSVPRYGIWTSTRPSPEPMGWPMRSRGFLLRVAIRITLVGESSVRLSSTRRPTRHGRSARDARYRWSPRI
jgi:hypothetical protein